LRRPRQTNALRDARRDRRRMGTLEEVLTFLFRRRPSKARQIESVEQG
jgi:hypothetical protein